MQTVKNTLFILIFVALLGACGLKGPLYLPNENPVSEPVAEQVPTTETNTEDNQEDNEDEGKNDPDAT